jgi:hypothetical protein
LLCGAANQCLHAPGHPDDSTLPEVFEALPDRLMETIAAACSEQ